ncbi:unnamed protein product [Spodoptera exigua]|nr:unnamed protein product [Spodoptera exigua]
MGQSSCGKSRERVRECRRYLLRGRDARKGGGGKGEAASSLPSRNRRTRRRRVADLRPTTDSGRLVDRYPSGVATNISMIPSDTLGWFLVGQEGGGPPYLKRVTMEFLARSSPTESTLWNEQIASLRGLTDTLTLQNIFKILFDVRKCL